MKKLKKADIFLIISKVLYLIGCMLGVLGGVLCFICGVGCKDLAWQLIEIGLGFTIWGVLALICAVYYDWIAADKCDNDKE